MPVCVCVCVESFGYFYIMDLGMLGRWICEVSLWSLQEAVGPSNTHFKSSLACDFKEWKRRWSPFNQTSFESFRRNVVRVLPPKRRPSSFGQNVVQVHQSEGSKTIGKSIFFTVLPKRR